MRVTAKIQRPQKNMVSQGVPLPACVGGWDGISPLANMPVDRAYQLDNWVPKPGWIEPRKGYIVQSSGLGSASSPVETVMAYNGFASNKLFGVCAGAIYDVTASGGTAIPTGIAGIGSSRVQYVMFSNAASLQYLVTVNGSHPPLAYNGTTWTTPTITGNGGPNLLLIEASTVDSGNVLKFAALNSSLQNTSISTPYGDTLLFADTTGVAVGMFVTAASVLPGTTVLAVTSTTVQLSTRVLADIAMTDPVAFATGASPVLLFTSADTPAGDTLPFASTTGLAIGMFAVGENVDPGSTIIATTPTSAQLSAVILGDVPLAAPIAFSVAADPVLLATSAATYYGDKLNFTSTTGLQVGYYIVGPDIQIDSTIIALTSTTVQMSSRVLADVPRATTIVFSPTAGTTGIEVGNYAVGAGIQTETQVISFTPTSVSISTNITSPIPAGQSIQFNPTAVQAGIDPSTFINVNSYAGRLWYVPENSTEVVYMNTVGGVSGPASRLPLGQLMQYGGYVQAIGTWTVDTRQNVDEYLAIITSRGEVIVYQGTDPSTTSTWSLVGRYKVGAPLGRRCFLRIAGDLQLITVDGVVGMSEMLSTDRAAANRVSLTSIIMNPINNAAAAYRNNFGWQLIEYALGTGAILNVPVQENVVQNQFFMNTITGAWSRFIGINPSGEFDATYGINSNCWEVDSTDNIFFGGNDGKVYKWGVGSGDGDKPITALVKGAYNSFGNAAELKNYQMLQALITTTGNPIPAIGINVDFNDTTALSTEQPVEDAVARWDTAIWDDFPWGPAATTTNNFLSVQGIGHYVSIVTQVTTYPNPNNPSSSSVTQLNGWNVIAQKGAFV